MLLKTKGAETGLKIYWTTKSTLEVVRRATWLLINLTSKHGNYSIYQCSYVSIPQSEKLGKMHSDRTPLYLLGELLVSVVLIAFV